MATTTVAIDQENVNKVKAYIIGKGYSIGEFYAMASTLLMDVNVSIPNKTDVIVQDLSKTIVIGKPYKPTS